MCIRVTINHKIVDEVCTSLYSLQHPLSLLMCCIFLFYHEFLFLPHMTIIASASRAKLVSFRVLPPAFSLPRQQFLSQRPFSPLLVLKFPRCDKLLSLDGQMSFSIRRKIQCFCLFRPRALRCLGTDTASWLFFTFSNRYRVDYLKKSPFFCNWYILSFYFKFSLTWRLLTPLHL